MAHSVSISSQHKAAKVAGFMFLFSFVVPTLNYALVLSNFIVKDDVMATAGNIMSNQFLFRIGITIELIMALGLIVLAVALYTILKNVSRNLAVLALLWKLAEAALVGVLVVISFISLHMLNGTASVPEFELEQFQALAGVLLDQHTALYSIPMVFLGLDMMLFSYLFLRSKYIPRTLAGFGILSFALIFIHALMYIIAPEYAAMPINQLIFYTPSGLFEIIIGLWLLIKGLNIPSPAKSVIEVQ